MRGPVWRARRTARLSNVALQKWAADVGFKLFVFESAGGNPRNGIADAALIRIRPKSPDQVEVYLVQLKGGGSGFKAAEMARLTKAASAVKAQPLIILHDGEQLHFLGSEPSFTGARKGKR
jgi:hypothetical protein